MFKLLNLLLLLIVVGYYMLICCLSWNLVDCCRLLYAIESSSFVLKLLKLLNLLLKLLIVVGYITCFSC